MDDEKNINGIKVTGKIGQILTKKAVILGGIIGGLILLFSGAQYFITIDDGSYKDNDWSNTGYVVSQTISNEYTLGIDLDAKATEIIQKLEEERGDLTKYIKEKDGKTVKDYLITFLKAELITQYPDLRSSEQIQNRTTFGK